MGMLYAAIDIHKHVFQAATLDPSSGELGDQRGGQALSCGHRCCAGEHNQEDSGEASTAVESAEEMRPDGARENAWGANTRSGEPRRPMSRR
jgi:hypothetical protein